MTLSGNELNFWGRKTQAHFIFRIGVMATRLTLTQEVVVQIHDPEPNTSNFFVSFCNTAISSKKTEGGILNPEMSVRVW